MRRMTVHFYVRNAKLFSSDQLKTYDSLGLSYIKGDLRSAMVYSGSYKWIRKNTHASLSGSLVNFFRAESISQLLAPLSGIFINSELYRRLQEMLKKLPLDGRPIHGNSFINMMTSTVT